MMMMMMFCANVFAYINDDGANDLAMGCARNDIHCVRNVLPHKLRNDDMLHKVMIMIMK